MAAHRYWRFLVNSNGRPGDVLSLMEIGAATAVGGANQLTGSTVTASTQLGGWAATQAIDGNLATGWATTNAATVLNEWIAFDLGAANAKDLSAEFWLTARNDSFFDQTPIGGAWQWSDDNVNWTTALDYSWRGNMGSGQTFYTPALAGGQLDAYRKSTNLAISGRNLVVSATGAGGVRASRDLRGLVYFEATITTLTGTPQVGLAPMTWDHATALGTGNNTLGYQPGGQVRINNATVQTIAAYAAGNRIGVAVDPLAKLVWFRVNGGNWNNNAANDPVTRTGGIDFSSLVTAQTLFPAFSASLTGTVWTTAFNTFVDAVPAGYAALDVAEFATQTIGFSDVSKALQQEVPGEQIPTPPLITSRSPEPITRMFAPAGTITKVSGLCEEGGVPVQGRLVEVFDRLTGDRLDYAYSAVDGSWECVALGRPSVRIVGSDPTTYNSVVYDNVVPV